MAERFVNLDRDTPLLLAPDMRDWVPQDDMVHFVIEAVAGVDLSAFRSERLPEEIARREKLLEKMEAARERLEAEAKRRAQSERAEYDKKLEAREKRQGGRKGPKPKAPSGQVDGGKQTNLSDGDSALMRKSKREGYTQSYNAQAAVDADGSQLILSNHVSRCASDANELEAALEGISQEIGRPERALADSGYINADAIERIEKSGVELYVSVGREDGNFERRYDYRPEHVRKKPRKKVCDKRLLAMEEKLKTQEGKEIYKARQQSVEPAFGIIKGAMGFRQFMVRGIDKVRGEWELVCVAHNMKRLWNLKMATA